jgi:lipopolysaccharide/colanic/teichoic acid biosynthesis glycosyltransferase
MSPSAPATAGVRHPAAARSARSGPRALPRIPDPAGRALAPYGGRELAVKHAVDRVLAALAILLLSPLLLLWAIAVKLSSSGPVLFRQRRVGRDDTYFEILKFRSMRPPGPAEEQLILLTGRAPGGVEGWDRRTWVGRLLRASSLDELPQLFNVLRGDMALVGPRPFVLEESERIDGWAARRFEVRPGLTGLWQVSGRSNLNFDELRRLDYLYVASWSLKWDLRIMWHTPACVLQSRGAY